MDNYIGPIEIKFLNKKKGRGIIATRSISKGDIILVEKPLGCAGFDEKEETSVAYEVNWETYVHSKHDHVRLCRYLVEMLPKMSAVNLYRLSLLCRGTRYTNKVKAETPKMDVFRYDELPSHIKS